MPKIERILIPIDFSESAKHALAYGRFLASKFGAKFDLLHVASAREVRANDDVTTLLRSVPGSTLEAFNEQEIQEKLNDWVREAGFGHEVRNDEIEQGNPAEVIVKMAKEGKYDLIAIGSHGHRTLGERVLGSVVEKVIRLAECPVVVCRRPNP